MVFTIVTIIFLPMSFIAACFSINIVNWNNELTMGYVSKYMFGIGLAISFVFVAMAFLVHDIRDAWKALLRCARTFYANFLRSKVSKLPPRGEDDEQQPDDVSVWTVRATLPGTAGAAGAASSTAYRWAAEDIDWKRRGGVEVVDRLPRVSRERDRYDHARLGLSPTRYGGHKISIGSGHGMSWRPSLDGRQGRLSEDLERGRDQMGLR